MLLKGEQAFRFNARVVRWRRRDLQQFLDDLTPPVRERPSA
jgi:hypothetical protein